MRITVMDSKPQHHDVVVSCGRDLTCPEFSVRGMIWSDYGDRIRCSDGIVRVINRTWNSESLRWTYTATEV